MEHWRPTELRSVMSNERTSTIRAVLYDSLCSLRSWRAYEPTVEELMGFSVRCPMTRYHVRRQRAIAVARSMANPEGLRNSEATVQKGLSCASPRTPLDTLLGPICANCSALEECETRYGAKVWTPPEENDAHVLVHPSRSDNTRAGPRGPWPTPRCVRYTQTEQYHNAVPFKPTEVHRLAPVKAPSEILIVAPVMRAREAWRQYEDLSECWGMNVLEGDREKMQKILESANLAHGHDGDVAGPAGEENEVLHRRQDVTASE